MISNQARHELLRLVLYLAGPGLTEHQREEIEAAIDAFEVAVRRG